MVHSSRRTGKTTGRAINLVHKWNKRTREAYAERGQSTIRGFCIFCKWMSRLKAANRPPRSLFPHVNKLFSDRNSPEREARTCTYTRSIDVSLAASLDGDG